MTQYLHNKHKELWYNRQEEKKYANKCTGSTSDESVLQHNYKCIMIFFIKSSLVQLNIIWTSLT